MSQYEHEYPPRSNYYAYSSGDTAPAASLAPYPRQPRLTYEPEGAFHSQPRLMPSPFGSSQNSNMATGDGHSDGHSDGRSDGRSDGYSDKAELEADRPRSSLKKVKSFIDNTFTGSTTGLGAGALGALVGGLAAREVIDRTSSRQQREGSCDDDSDDSEYERNQLIGTLVGATIGALGANAIGKRIERRRARDKTKQEMLEDKGRSAAHGDIGHSRYKRRGHHSRQHDRWNEGEGRDGGGSDSSGCAIERKDVARRCSWNTVEDWVLNVGNSGQDRDLS